MGKTEALAEDIRRLKDRASAALAEGRLREAEQLFERLVQLDTKDLALEMKLGDVYRRQGRTEHALRTYSRVARGYASDGQLLKGIAACKIILSLDAGHTETQAMLAELYAQRRAPRGAGPAVARIPLKRVAPAEGAQAPVAPSHFGAAPGADAGPTRRMGNIDNAQTWAGKVSLQDLEGIRARAQEKAQARPAPARLPPQLRTEESSLPEIPLFSDLPREAFVELLVRMKMREVPAGGVVVREGDAGTAFFVVSSGRFRVTRTNDQGRPVVLARLQEGAFFGEMAMLQRTARTATVTAEVDSQVLEISRDVLDRVIKAHPTVADVLASFQRQRLLATIMASHELFRPFSPTDRRSLMEKFKARVFPAETRILEEGDAPSGLYIILYGAARVSAHQGFEDVELARIGPGDMFGEMSLLTNEPTSATVVTVAETMVIRLSKGRFQEVMMTHPHVLEVVARISEQRQQENDDKLGLDLSPQAAILV